MSDLADRAAESCASVEGSGGVFQTRVRDASATARELRACSCGGRPQYSPHPPLVQGGSVTEKLSCMSCGNSVGPFMSRHQLMEAWNLGGWRHS